MRTLLLTLLLLTALSLGALAHADGLEVHFLNVARNDGILIRCGGEDVFLDSGTYKWGAVSAKYMQNVGVTSLKYYIGTHAHADHVGGAPSILAALPVGEVLEPHSGVERLIKNCAKKPAEKEAVNNARYTKLSVGQKVTVGDAVITCLGPLKVTPANSASTAENANSLVLMLTYGETRFLLTGDATGGSLTAINAASPGCLRANVYKNAHHNGETKMNILEMIRPEYTVISTASGNRPSSTFIEHLSEIGSKILITTDTHSGNFVLKSDGRNISVQPQYSATSVSLSANMLNVYEGKTAALKATLMPSKRFKALTYISDDPTIATVSGRGKVTGVRAGQTTIRVFDGSGVNATCQVTVQPATLVLKKASLSVKQGSKATISWSVQPSGKKPAIVWTSSHPDIATVDSKGKITGVYPGTATITGTMPSGQTSSLTVTVTPIDVRSIRLSPSSLKLTLGEARSIAAKVSPTNATWKEITYQSADSSIATISQEGLVSAVGVGKTTITATAKNGRTAKMKVTVNPVYVKKMVITGVPASLTAQVTGKNQAQLGVVIQPENATIQAVQWISSNKKILTVDENGLVTAHAAGKAYITAKATDGSKRSVKVRMTVEKNELYRKKIAAVPGKLVAVAQRLRYQGNVLEVQMKYLNQSGQTQLIPQGATLTIVTPQGERIGALHIPARQIKLKNRHSKTVTYKIPLTQALIGLDLSQCDAMISG